VVGRRGENFGVEKRWKEKNYEGKEDGIFVHLENGLNGFICNWCIGGCWFTPALNHYPFKGILFQIMFHATAITISVVPFQSTTTQTKVEMFY
jgi:hypothetical protein